VRRRPVLYLNIFPSFERSDGSVLATLDQSSLTLSKRYAILYSVLMYGCPCGVIQRLHVSKWLLTFVDRYLPDMPQGVQGAH
jgi:hypothetical protein